MRPLSEPCGGSAEFLEISPARGQNSRNCSSRFTINGDAQVTFGRIFCILASGKDTEVIGSVIGDVHRIFHPSSRIDRAQGGSIVLEIPFGILIVFYFDFSRQGTYSRQILCSTAGGVGRSTGLGSGATANIDLGMWEID